MLGSPPTTPTTKTGHIGSPTHGQDEPPQVDAQVPQISKPLGLAGPLPGDKKADPISEATKWGHAGVDRSMKQTFLIARQGHQKALYN